jgi:membrane protease YdiL (CAAX protease family)
MKTNSASRENRLLIVFLILTPLISVAIPAFLSLPAEVVPLILVFIPAIIAILFTAFSEGRKGVGVLLKKPFQWQINFKWYLIALGLAVGLRLTMSLLALLLGWIPAIRLNDWAIPQYLVFAIFTFIGAFMEELGWRGYALHKVLHHRSALASALIIGIPWGIVHLGLLLPGMMNEGTSWVATILCLINLSVILTWFFVQTGHGIFAGIVFHAAENYFVFLTGGFTAAEGLWLMTAVTLAIAGSLIIVYGTGLQRSPTNKFAIIDAR